MSVYFLQKEAVYYHGIFWIGEDKEEGIRQAKLHASSDYDTHHNWSLYLYEYQTVGFREDKHSGAFWLKAKRVFSTSKREEG